MRSNRRLPGSSQLFTIVHLELFPIRVQQKPTLNITAGTAEHTACDLPQLKAPNCCKATEPAARSHPTGSPAAPCSAVLATKEGAEAQGQSLPIPSGSPLPPASHSKAVKGTSPGLVQRQLVRRSWVQILPVQAQHRRAAQLLWPGFLVSLSPWAHCVP